MRHNSGFSLIEILLVLTVMASISVAAFVVYPKVQAARLKQQGIAQTQGPTSAAQSNTVATRQQQLENEKKQAGQFHSEFENGF